MASPGLLSVSVPISKPMSSVELAVAVPITTFSPGAGTPLLHCVGSLQLPVPPIQLSVCAEAATTSPPKATKRQAHLANEARVEAQWAVSGKRSCRDDFENMAILLRRVQLWLGLETPPTG